MNGSFLKKMKYRGDGLIETTPIRKRMTKLIEFLDLQQASTLAVPGRKLVLNEGVELLTGAEVKTYRCGVGAAMSIAGP